MITAKQTDSKNGLGEKGPEFVPILLTSRQAAALLQVGERTLWRLTDKGEIPVVRIGRLVRYDPRDLQRWIEKKK